MANTKPLKQVRKLSLRSIFRPVIRFFRQPVFRVIFLHTLILVAFFTLLAFFVKSDKWLFLILTIPLFLLGILHIWLLYNVHDWSDRLSTNRGREALFTLGINILGSIAVYFIFQRNELSPYSTIAALSTFIFSLSFFWDKAMQLYRVIPNKTYAPLQIKTLENVRGKYKVEQNNKGIVFLFEEGDNHFPKEPQKMYMPRSATMKTEEIPIENLFKVFLIHYETETNPQNPIPFYKNTSEGVSYIKWQFHHRPFGMLPQKILDPKAGIGANRMSYRKLQTGNKEHSTRKINVIKLYIKIIKDEEQNSDNNEFDSTT